MGQKTNPISLRLNIDRHFDSCWYPGQISEYGQYIQKDLNIREYLKSLFASLGLYTGRINVQMFAKKLHIHYFFHPDPASQRKRFLKNSQESKFSSDSSKSSVGLSFLRSIREKQKLSSIKKSLTFREALALERQKNEDPQRVQTLSKSSKIGKKKDSSFLSEEISKVLLFKDKLKTLNFSTDSQRSAESKKLFIFKGLDPLEFPKEISQLNFHSQKIKIQKSLSKFSLKTSSLLKSAKKKKSSQILEEMFLEKCSKISENLRNIESLCRFTTYSPSKGLMIGEYSPVFLKKNGMNFFENEKYSLWSKFYSQRALFLKEKNLEHIEEILGKSLGSETKLLPFKIQSRTRSAHFLCQTVIQQFQKNISFRQIYKNLFKDIQADPSVQGIRLVCSGRFGGIEMARVESRKYGQTSLHVFSSHIDYAHGHALTSSGLLGVKIWISYRPTLTNTSSWVEKWSALRRDPRKGSPFNN